MPRKSLATPQKPKTIEEDEQTNEHAAQGEVTNEKPVQTAENTVAKEHFATPRKSVSRTPGKRTPKPQIPKFASASPTSAPSATPSKSKADAAPSNLQTPKRPRVEPPKEVTETPLPPAIENDDEEIDPFDFAGEDNEVPEAISVKAGQEQSEKLSAEIKAEEKKFAEEQKAKKKLFQKQSQKEVPETEELPADLLEQAALEQAESSKDAEEEETQTKPEKKKGTKKPQHKYFIEQEAMKKISEKNAQTVKGTSVLSGISIVNLNAMNSTSTLPQKSAHDFMNSALYGGRQRRANNIAPKGERPAKVFIVDEARKKRNEKRQINELRTKIRLTRGADRSEMIEEFKQLKSGKK